MALKSLTALPVFNEVDSVDSVLDEVLRYSESVLVVDDGSSDGTRDRLRARASDRLRVVTHFENRGYGAALQSAFEFAQENRFETIVTVDCDGQHEPRLIPTFVEASAAADIVSGSRYLSESLMGELAPADRRRINKTVTEELNAKLGLQLTDAFCGFNAYRVSALKSIELTQTGYAMPLELWVQAACAGLRVVEMEVPLIYLAANRSFGEALDDADVRLAHYRQVIEQSIRKRRRDCPALCEEGVG